MDINSISIKDIGLSVRSYNALTREGVTTVGDMLGYSEESLYRIRNLGVKSVEEILQKIEECKTCDPDKFIKPEEPEDDNILHDAKLHDRILEFVKANDKDIDKLDLSGWAKNPLKCQGYSKISDFIFLTERDIRRFSHTGEKTVNEILSFIDGYMAENMPRITAALEGDEGALWADEFLKSQINKAFNKIGFKGCTSDELRDIAEIPEQVSDDRFKNIISSMLTSVQLTHENGLLYRTHLLFEKYYTTCPDINDFSKTIIRRKLEGETFEQIGKDLNLTKERIRQKISKDIWTVRRAYMRDTGTDLFSEDRYRNFFETYSFSKKDTEKWFGISGKTIAYLELTGSSQGAKDLKEALNDPSGIPPRVYMGIERFLNRNKIFIGGQWVNRTRADLEEYVVRTLCTENTSFDDFQEIYNGCLRKAGIPYDKNIYFTDAVKRTREHHLQAAKYLLWKQNRQFRCYDIDGRDFTELLETLDLDVYENIELSTLKFMRDYPEVMKRYDIRDHYELHNLLRKIIEEGSYHDFHCKKMPTIRFGHFDKNKAMMELLLNNAPISQTDFADLVSVEYGFDTATVIGNYLHDLSPHCNQGIYYIEQKVMSDENREILLEHLNNDFYYISELKAIYSYYISNADTEEINAYNLKKMGFTTLSDYAYRNHSSLEEYFRSILTEKDVTDIAPLRKRYAYIKTFSDTLSMMKRDREVIEYEPNRIITFNKLATLGITEEDITAFCDQVADFVEDGTYFSVRSIRKDGFRSELTDKGFPDRFYSSLLAYDGRFTYKRVYHNIILCKGTRPVTIMSFKEDLVKARGSVPIDELIDEMVNTYGCRIANRQDVVFQDNSPNVRYDRFSARLYYTEKY